MVIDVGDIDGIHTLAEDARYWCCRADVGGGVVMRKRKWCGRKSERKKEGQRERGERALKL